MPETRTVKGFAEVGLPLAEGDFECCTFDHSDNSPYFIVLHFELAKMLYYYNISFAKSQEQNAAFFILFDILQMKTQRNTKTLFRYDPKRQRSMIAERKWRNFNKLFFGTLDKRRMLCYNMLCCHIIRRGVRVV